MTTGTPARFASESGHWYTKDGILLEDVDQNGKPITLREARKQQLSPGFTSVSRMLAKPGLASWINHQHVLAAERFPRQAGETDADWFKRTDEAARVIPQAAADEGSRIHAAIESHFSGRLYPDEYRPHVLGVSKLLNETLGEQVWLPEKVAVHRFGYGTKIDLHSSNWILDFKGKDGDQESLQRERLYLDHHMQLAAGDHAIGSRSRRGAIVFVSRTHPGACWMVESNNDQMRKGWDMFLGALYLWQTERDYAPDWSDVVSVSAFRSR